jgi:hypothetical protein
LQEYIIRVLQKETVSEVVKKSPHLMKSGGSKPGSIELATGPDPYPY